MIRFVAWSMLKWIVRFAALFGLSYTVVNVVHERLGYRIDFWSTFVITLAAIVCLRLWMPWSDAPPEDRGPARR